MIPFFAEQLEQCFSVLYGMCKKLEDIALDSIVMAPSMIKHLAEMEEHNHSDTLYIVTEDWANHGEIGGTVKLFSALSYAQAYMCHRVAEAIAAGNTPFDRRGENEIEESSSGTFYEIFDIGWYAETHYAISIEQKSINGTKVK